MARQKYADSPMFMRLPRTFADIASAALPRSDRCPKAVLPSSAAVISRALLRRIFERHRVRAFFQPLGPDREAVAIPVQDLDPVAPPVGEDEQMSGECVQFQSIA